MIQPKLYKLSDSTKEVVGINCLSTFLYFSVAAFKNMLFGEVANLMHAQVNI